MACEEHFQVLALIGVQPMGSAAQQAKPGSVPAQIGTELAGNAHEVQSGHAYRMEAIRHDPGPREPAFDEKAVGVRQVDAHHPDPVAAAKRGEIAGQLRLAASRANVEDPVLLQIAEGRHEALAPMQGMLVYAQDPRAILAQPLLGLPFGKLRVDPTHRRLAQVFPLRQPRRADAVVMAPVHFLPPALRAVPPGSNPGQGLHEAALAAYAPPPMAINLKPAL